MSKALVVQPVSEVECATSPLRERSGKEAIESLVKCEVEACSEYAGKIVRSPYHPFVDAVHTAFAEHRRLVLSPDMFWLLISQGFARHVNNHSDELRSRIVRKDADEICVRRDDFVKGSPENPWSEVFSEFSTAIKEHIGEQNHSNIVVSFSTTGCVEQAANEIILMESMKSYFRYGMRTRCGIPEVTLEGTTEDWQRLHEQARRLGSAYGLAWWTDRLLPTLERMALNAAGEDDSELWNNIYKLNNESGGPYINGWILDFFPYVQGHAFVHKESRKVANDLQTVHCNEDEYELTSMDVPNPMSSGKRCWGITAEALPASTCKVPFTWDYLDCLYSMEFVAGFIGLTQDAETLALRPKIGWAVCEAQ